MSSFLCCRARDLNPQEKFERASNQLDRMKESANTRKIIRCVADFTKYCSDRILDKDSRDDLFLRSFRLLDTAKKRKGNSSEDRQELKKLSDRCVYLFCRRLRQSIKKDSPEYPELLEDRLSTAYTFARKHPNVRGERLIAEVVATVVSSCEKRCKASVGRVEYDRSLTRSNRRYKLATRVSEAFQRGRSLLRKLESKHKKLKKRIRATRNSHLTAKATKEFKLEVATSILEEERSANKKGARKAVRGFYTKHAIPLNGRNGTHRLDTLLKIAQADPNLLKEVVRIRNWHRGVIATESSASDLYSLSKIAPKGTLDIAWQEVIKQVAFWKGVAKEQEEESRVARHVSKKMNSNEALEWLKSDLPLAAFPILAGIFDPRDTSSHSSGSDSSSEDHHRLTLLNRRFLSQISSGKDDDLWFHKMLRQIKVDSDLESYFVDLVSSSARAADRLPNTNLIKIALFIIEGEVAKEALPHILDAIERNLEEEGEWFPSFEDLLKVSKYAKANDHSVYDLLIKSVQRTLDAPWDTSLPWMYNLTTSGKYKELCDDVITPSWFGSLERSNLTLALKNIIRTKRLSAKIHLFSEVPAEYYHEWSTSEFRAVLDLVKKAKRSACLSTLLTIAEGLPQNISKKKSSLLYKRLIEAVQKCDYPTDALRRLSKFPRTFVGRSEETYVAALLQTKKRPSTSSDSNTGGASYAGGGGSSAYQSVHFRASRYSRSASARQITSSSSSSSGGGSYNDLVVTT